MKRTILITTLALATALALVLTAVAAGHGGRGGDKGKRKQNAARTAAVTVYDLKLTPRQEVPPVTNLQARARGLLTLDVTRDSAGNITSGEVVFYVNYDFPGSFTFAGLHVHQGQRGTNGPIVVDSGIGGFTDSDGDGNVTSVVVGVSPAVLQAILDNPRNYYVNFHTSVNPSGALRDQLRNGKGQKNKNDDDSDD